MRRAVATAGVLLLAACGGGGDGSSTDDAPPGAPEPTAGPVTTPRPVPSPSPAPTPPPDSATRCIAPIEPARGGELRLEPWSSHLFESPVAMAQSPGDDEAWFVVEQRGTIRRVTAEDGERRVLLALDWRDVVVDPIETRSAETGLLGLAFHPDHPTDPRAYVYATLTPAAPGACPRITVAELAVENGVFDPEPRRLLLEHATNCFYNEDGTFQSGHNAGTIHFDPRDGSLVVGIGDLARKHLAQDPEAIEGTLLRLDVDSQLFENPGDLEDVAVRAEVLAYGLRNPWKWSFDRATGDVWIGDVGLSMREEINRFEAGQTDTNYGWPVWEGELCSDEDCEEEGFVFPVHEYAHGSGCSVTGGFVYRGDAHEDLHGVYLFADWCSGLVWGLLPGKSTPVVLADHAGPIVSFAEGNDGELLALDWNGHILQVAGFTLGDRDGFPSRLSESGCVEEDDPTRAATGVLPYEVNVAFWSDEAEKQRWLAVPPNTEIYVEEDGALTLPPGAVLVKEFVVDGERVETRLLMHHDDAGWQGYAYAWTGDDAVLASPFGETRVTAGGRAWHIPGRQECSRCHTERAGHTLGLEVSQLDRAVERDGATVSQLDHLVAEGVLDAESLAAAIAPTFPSSDETDLDMAARAYLHVNCAPCHRPGARTYFPEMDLRASIAIEEMKVCDVAPQRFFPAHDARLAAPGAPEVSVLLGRIEHEGDFRMPPLASQQIDEEGAQLIEDWLLNLDACPEGGS